MKILHAYCLNHNLGDYYLGIGIKNLLRNYLPVDLIAETNLQGTVFNEYFIDNVLNKKYDLLVIGGGGIIHGAHWPNGWFWLIKQEYIDRIKIPFIVYGAGYNYFANEDGIPEIGKKHLTETINRATLFSVRNDGSHIRLQDQIGINVKVVPDPGFHIDMGRHYTCPEFSPFVIVQLAYDKSEYRFSGSLDLSSFIDEIRKAIKTMTRKYKVILAPHVYEDLAISKQVAEGLENVEIWDFDIFAFDRAVESIGYYKNAEFVIAMRGHGQIVPFAFGTPVISLENHPKHVGLMDELGLLEYNLPISSENLGRRIEEKIKMVEDNHKWYRAHLHEKKQSFDDQAYKVFTDIRVRLGLK